MRCEDYPCCGHTSEDPCERQPYDEPGFFDTSIPGNEHALCDHESGDCAVDDYDEEGDAGPYSPLDDIPWGTPDEWIPDNPDDNGMRMSDFI